MPHREYIRNVEGSNTAIIFIHGIMGTPDQFKDLVPLVPDSFTVHNLLLPGHGKAAEDFSRTSMREWEKKVTDTLCTLSETHENIILVGHSMGTLLSIDTALRYPDNVKLLFLQAVPLTPRLKPRVLRYAHAVIRNDSSEDTPDEAAAREACSINVEKDPRKYTGWPERFKELFKKSWVIRKKLSLIPMRCVAFQSREDELVSNRSENILRKHKNIITHTLRHSSHYIYSNSDKEKMLACFQKEINRINS